MYKFCLNTNMDVDQFMLEYASLERKIGDPEVKNIMKRFLELNAWEITEGAEKRQQNFNGKFNFDKKFAAAHRIITSVCALENRYAKETITLMNNYLYMLFEKEGGVIPINSRDRSFNTNFQKASWVMSGTFSSKDNQEHLEEAIVQVKKLIVTAPLVHILDNMVKFNFLVSENCYENGDKAWQFELENTQAISKPLWLLNQEFLLNSEQQETKKQDLFKEEIWSAGIDHFNRIEIGVDMKCMEQKKGENFRYKNPSLLSSFKKSQTPFGIRCCGISKMFTEGLSYNGTQLKAPMIPCLYFFTLQQLWLSIKDPKSEFMKCNEMIWERDTEEKKFLFDKENIYVQLQQIMKICFIDFETNKDAEKFKNYNQMMNMDLIHDFWDDLVKVNSFYFGFHMRQSFEDLEVKMEDISKWEPLKNVDFIAKFLNLSNINIKINSDSIQFKINNMKIPKQIEMEKDKDEIEEEQRFMQTTFQFKPIEEEIQKLEIQLKEEKKKNMKLQLELTNKKIEDELNLEHLRLKENKTKEEIQMLERGEKEIQRLDLHQKQIFRNRIRLEKQDLLLIDEEQRKNQELMRIIKINEGHQTKAELIKLIENKLPGDKLISPDEMEKICLILRIPYSGITKKKKEKTAQQILDKAIFKVCYENCSRQFLNLDFCPTRFIIKDLIKTGLKFKTKLQEFNKKPEITNKLSDNEINQLIDDVVYKIEKWDCQSNQDLDKKIRAGYNLILENDKVDMFWKDFILTKCNSEIMWLIRDYKYGEKMLFRINRQFRIQFQVTDDDIQKRKTFYMQSKSIGMKKIMHRNCFKGRNGCQYFMKFNNELVKEWANTKADLEEDKKIVTIEDLENNEIIIPQNKIQQNLVKQFIKKISKNKLEWTREYLREQFVRELWEHQNYNLENKIKSNQKKKEEQLEQEINHDKIIQEENKQPQMNKLLNRRIKPFSNEENLLKIESYQRIIKEYSNEENTILNKKLEEISKELQICETKLRQNALEDESKFKIIQLKSNIINFNYINRAIRQFVTS